MTISYSLSPKLSLYFYYMTLSEKKVALLEMCPKEAAEKGCISIKGAPVGQWQQDRVVVGGKNKFDCSIVREYRRKKKDRGTRSISSVIKDNGLISKAAPNFLS